MNEINKKIVKTKSDNEQILNFVALELSKLNIENKNEAIEQLTNEIDTKYFTKKEIKDKLENKIEIYKKSNSNYTQTFKETNLVNLENLERYRDLSKIPDPTLHFSKHHLSLARRVFYWQVTQNYLAAIKWFVLNDLVSQQTKFNSATEDSLKKILNLISESKTENSISISELKNHANESEKWMQSNQNIIDKLSAKVATIDDLSAKVEKFDELSAKIVNLTSIEIDELSAKVTTLDDLSAKIENFDKLSAKLANLTSIEIDELASKVTKLDELNEKIKEILLRINEFSTQISRQNEQEFLTNLQILYNVYLKRNPAPWESDMWKNNCQQGISFNEIPDQLKNSELLKKAQKKFLVQKGFTIEKENLAFKKIHENTFYFDFNDHIITELIFQGENYEKSTIEFLSKIVNEGMNVINIGANIGIISIAIANFVGDQGKVISFEPYKPNLKFLQKNLEVNKIKNVVVINKAVSNKVGKENLWLKDSGAWHFVSSTDNPGLKKLKIDTITIDDFLKSKKFNIDLIIMDAEGSEKNILEGMQKTLQKNPNLEIITEFNPFTLELAGSNAKEFLEKIEEYGFAISIIDEEKNSIEPITKESLLQKIQYPKFTNLYLKR